MKKITFLLVLGMSFMFIYKVTLAQDKQGYINPQASTTATIRGVITKCKDGSVVDSPCEMEVEVDGRIFSVVCGQGMSPCYGQVNHPLNYGDANKKGVNVGDKVEIYGQITYPGRLPISPSISICPSKDFYIKKIVENPEENKK